MSIDDPDTEPPALCVRNVSKVFRGEPALQGVELEVWPGEVHALLGHNGSGKSTLIKILAGYHKPEPGWTATRAGEPFELGSASGAHAAGLRFIHQDPAVIGELDVSDNLALGERYSRRFWVSDRRERREARKILASFGVDIDPAVPLRALGPAQRTVAAIVRAIHHGSQDGILVLDEPTATLSEQESVMLFSLIERIRQNGAAILYVTHRLDEVFRIADRITVLRDGRRIVTRPVEGLGSNELVELIVGKPFEITHSRPQAVRDDPVLSVTGLNGPGVHDVSLTVHAGEVVGVTGLMGSGMERLLSFVFGSEPRTAGDVIVHGRSLVQGSPTASIAAGVGFAPADRKRMGAVEAWSLRENLTLPRLKSVARTGWLSQRRERGDAASWLQRLNVLPPDPEAPFSSLSGGNQQKLALAKWLRSGVDVLLLEEPTAGVDVGSSVAIYEAIAAASDLGIGVLVSSSDTDELATICDRVIVMRSGRCAITLERDECDVARLVAESARVDDDVEHREKVA